MEEILEKTDREVFGETGGTGSIPDTVQDSGTGSIPDTLQYSGTGSIPDIVQDSGTAAGIRRSRALPVLCRIFGILCLAVTVSSLLISWVPLKLGYSEYYVISGSMEPQVPVYSILYALPVDPSTLEAGDIASFKVGQTTVVHRVMINNVDKRSLVTKGDANEDVDFREISYDNVRGKVVKQYPRLGEMLMIYLTKCGKAMLVLFAAAGVLLLAAAHKMSEYSAINRKEKQRNKKKVQKSIDN